MMGSERMNGRQGDGLEFERAHVFLHILAARDDI